MNRATVIVAILILMLAIGANAEQVGTVVGDQQDVRMLTLPVVHDTTGRTDASLTARELHFLSQVPEVVGSKTGKTLRDACREMILGLVIHVPALPCGNWTPNDSKRYWGIYQAWTGPAKVRVPVIPGPAGRDGIDGQNGQNGRDGRDGQNGRDGRVVFVVPQRQVGWKVNPTRHFYYEQGWFTASVSALLMPRTRIDNSSSSTSCGGAGGSVGDITNNNANTNVNPNTNNNVINIGDGTATGTATGTGTGTSTAGN